MVSRTLVKRKLLDQLAERHKFSVPAGLVDLEFEGIWKQVEDAKAAGQKVEGDEEKLKEVEDKCSPIVGKAYQAGGGSDGDDDDEVDDDRDEL